MHVLVTGDQGYIGSSLVPLLLSHDFVVSGIDAAYFKQELDTPKNKVAYKKLRKDIRDVVEEDLRGVDAIVHLAALSNDPIGQLSPDLTHEINFEASVHLARLAKKTGVKKFLFASSCSVYGASGDTIADESSPTLPLTAYAKSKILTEKKLQSLSDNSFCVCLLRNSTVYGYAPKFRDDLVVNNLVSVAFVERKIKIKSDGTAWRPLIDVRDLSEIIYQFLKAESSEICGGIYNIGFRENNVRVKDIVDVIVKHMPDCEVVYTGESGKDTRNYRVSFKKFTSLFPGISQKWTVERSVIDLLSHLALDDVAISKIEGNKFTRLHVLTELMRKGLISESLRWKKNPKL